MIGYKGRFIKKDGTERTMLFCKLNDLPEDFLSDRILGLGSPKKLPEGMELVYDLEASGFRVFNHKTKISDLIKVKVPNKVFKL